MANRVSWFWGPFWAAKTAQLPSLDLSRLFKQEIPYAIEEIVVVGGAFVTTVAIAYVLDFALLVAFFSALIVWCLVYCQDVPNIYFSTTECNVAIMKHCPALKTKYRYPFWTASPHFSTLWNGMIRKALPMEFDRFLIPVADGGTLAVDYTAPPKCPANAPIAFIIPGTGGTSHASYVRTFAASCLERGWRIAVFTWRGCGTLPLTSAKLSAPGDTEDLILCLKHVRKSYPLAPILGCGFSMGGNLLAKYIGESSATCEMVAGLALCQGYDNKKALKILNNKSRFYSWAIAKKWKDLVAKNSHKFRGIVDLDHVAKAETLEHFDQLVSIKLHGHEVTETFYDAHNCHPVLDHVKVPLLCVNAMNDPLICSSLIPYDLPTKNPNIILATTGKGGHLAWCEGTLWPNTKSWIDRAGAEFLAAALNAMLPDRAAVTASSS